MLQPDWATLLITEVCKAHKRKEPKVKWIKRNRRGTTGITYQSHIVMCVGNIEERHKYILLHELAHWILDKRRQVPGHPVRFWRKAFELYKQYDCLTEYVKQSEFSYKKKAELVYNSL